MTSPMNTAAQSKKVNEPEVGTHTVPAAAARWGLLPKESPDASAESLALGLSPANGLNCSERAQAEIIECFRGVIDPIANPEKYAELQKQFGSRGKLVRHIAAENGISTRTLYRKQGLWKAQGVIGISRKIRVDRGSSRVFNAAAEEFILAAYLPKPGSYGELSVRDVYRLYAEERRYRAEHSAKPVHPEERARNRRYLDADGCFLPSAQFPEASYRTFCREVAKIPDLVKKMGRGGNEAYQNSELLSFREFESLLPLDFVVMDHRVLDIFCLVRTRDGWNLIRPWITAAIDMRTRKWLGWTIVETPSSDSIAATLKHVFIEHGLPKAAYFDNGKDFRCFWLEGRREHVRTAKRADSLPEKWTGVLETLGIRVHHAIVKRSRSKLIEPAWGAIADFDRTTPYWCGHKPGARPERFDRLLSDHDAWLAGKLASPPFLTIEQVSDLYSRAIADINEREHHGEGLRKVTPTGVGWMCPNEAWEILIPRVERRTIPEEVLQLCFAKRRELTVRNGEIQTTFDGRQYHYRLVGNRMALLGLNDRKVELAYDPLDLGKAAVYYEAAFIGLAECFELRRQGEAAFVEDERDRRRARREVKRWIKAVHQAIPVPSPDEHLRRRQEVLPSRIEPERPAGTVALPAAIEAAAKAQAEEREFSFADAQPITVAAIEHEPSDDSDEFRFFAEQGDR